jgi:FAD/FMN-containing dehydrogenase
MKTTGHLSSRAAMAARTLRESMAGSVLLAGDQDYETARLVWNGAVSRMPAVIARCASEDDVVAVVRTAREHGLPLSVRGGGHDWAGRALCDGGLVADLSAMRDVMVTTAWTAIAGGGATAGDVVAAARPHGLVPVTGTVKAVGQAGLTLAGGYGWCWPTGGR